MASEQRTEFIENMKIASAIMLIPFILLMLVVIFPIFLLTVIQLMIRSLFTGWTYLRYRKTSAF